MKNLTLITKIKSFILNHKLLSLAFLIIIIVSSYFIFKNKNNGEIRYITNKVEKGNIAVSISGSGQVESLDSININAKVSGDIVYVPVKVGQEVRRGALIASIDSRDAKIALENAQISLDKMKKPSTLTVLQKENSLNKLYSDGWSSISSFIVDMDSIIVGLEDLHNEYLGSQNKMLLSRTGKEKIDLSEKAYWETKKNLDELTELYKSLSISSSKEDIKNLISISLDTAKKISNAVKLSQTSFDYTSNALDEADLTRATSVQSDLTSWTTSVNSYVNSIFSNLNNIDENTQSLKDTLLGSDELDIRQAELTLETKNNAYNDCFVRAPFDGIIASLTAKVGQSASGSIGTLIAKQKIVKISLNEVDIAKIKLDQKATLSFDAIDGLIITGSVVGIDSVGTVSQGVVTYNVQIGLDIEDVRVKPGMSVDATIVTSTAQNVLVVPNSAIKSKNESNYVEIFTDGSVPVSIGAQGILSPVLPNRVKVKTGLSDDNFTEIIEGIKEGDILVIKTINSSNKKATSAPSIFGAVGGTRTSTGSGAMRNIQPH